MPAFTVASQIWCNSRLTQVPHVDVTQRGHSPGRSSLPTVGSSPRRYAARCEPRVCALSFWDADARSTIEEAIERVRGVIPNAVDVRDALEHFDDYLLGIGNQLLSDASDGDVRAVWRRGW